MAINVFILAILVPTLAVLIVLFWDVSKDEDKARKEIEKELKGWWEYFPPDETEYDEEESRESQGRK